ncbi:MAG: bacillithiol biosynthesis deacetylase BshB1 [Bacteroidota bacterium]
MKLDVLAIGAHPDDIELACGGTIARIVQQGKKVGILDMTQGELGTRGSREIRHEEAMKAAKILGVELRDNLELPDGKIEMTFENRLKTMTVIRRYRPEILIIPHHLDRHPDHEHAHLLAKEAWYYAGLEKMQTYDDGKLQEPFRPKKIFHFMQRYGFPPSFIVDISEQFEIRMNAVRAFRSQFYDPNSRERETLLSRPDFLEHIETRLRYWGNQIGVRYGEPFYSYEAIGIKDIFSIAI